MSEFSSSLKMSTRNGKTFVNPPMSARELRLRKQEAAKERAAAAAKAAESSSQAVAALSALEESFVPPILPPVHAIVPAAKTNPVLQTTKPTKKKPKSKKPKPKKPKKLTVTKRFPYGIPEPMVKSFNDFFEETSRVDFTNSDTRDSGLLTVGSVHKVYRAWCDKNNRTYCPERTSKQWNRAPFVVNAKRIDKMPPFRMLMFAKLDRMPKRSKDVFSATNTAWRRHKKTYGGHPYYQGLKYKDSFTPTVKYTRKKESRKV